MKKLAMIPPQFLPVPAVCGGAVEVLSTSLIEGNEQNPRFNIDVFSKKNNSLNNIQYKHTNIIQVSVSLFSKIIAKLYNKKVYYTKKGNYISESDVWILMKILRGNYDVILVENDMLICERIIRKIKKSSKIIYHMHNDYDGTSKTPELVEKIVQGVDSFLVISEYLKQQVLKVEDSQKVKVLYNAIDIGKFSNKNVNKNLIRSRFGISKEDIVFIYSGRVTKEKGVKELLQAYIEMKKVMPNLKSKLMIVGESWFSLNQESKYTNKLKELSSGQDDIVFTGFINPENMPEILAAADVALIPSLWEEPFGLVVLEAMAAGLFIIATKSGAIPEIINNEMGILLENDEHIIDSLRKAMIKALDVEKNQIKIQKMKNNLLCHEEFDIRNYFENFCSLIDE